MILGNAARLVFSLLGAVSVGQAPSQGPARIILIRHAEKPSKASNPHLSRAGVQRAERLVSYITTDPAMLKLGSPVAIFATHATKDENGQRTGETVAPLARALRLTVQMPFLGKDYAKLARRILKDPALAGKTVLICWNHEEIPQLVGALGVTPIPSKWKGSVFDAVYIITYRAGHAELSQAAQHYSRCDVGESGSWPVNEPPRRSCCTARRWRPDARLWFPS